MKKNIIVTGGLGFIGSNFLNMFVPSYPDYQFINIDAERYSADHNNVANLKRFSNYGFIKADIVNMDTYIDSSIDMVINFAAESHVTNSQQNSAHFVETNVKGTHSLLEFIRKMKQQYQKNIRYVHISTDEVYGDFKYNAGQNNGNTENSKYIPTNPYSATKAASDLLVYSYHKTYGLNTVITNCSNNYGPRQHEEKLVPFVIKSLLHGLPITIHGNGSHIRDWIYVEDHCNAIWKVAQLSFPGTQYNIAGRKQMSTWGMVHELYNRVAQRDARVMPLENYITFIPDRFYNDCEYRLDDTKMRQIFNWQPAITFDDGLDKTVQYYMEKWV